MSCLIMSVPWNSRTSTTSEQSPGEAQEFGPADSEVSKVERMPNTEMTV